MSQESAPVIHDDTSQIWLLGFKDGTFVRSIDSVPEAVVLACFNEADAIKAAAYQNEQWLDDDSQCHPVRVK